MPATTSCPRCGEPWHEGEPACTHCGAGMHGCPTCGGGVADGDRFCGHCGSSQDGATILPGMVEPEPSPWDEVLERLRKATLGEFQIKRELGRGGMAAVYLAHDIALNRKVAIKVMSPGILMGPGMVERFKREAITVANLNHPHIVTIHAVRQVAGLHFFVMKLIAGRSLERVVKEGGGLPVSIVQAILFQVGSALAYGHRRGVIHRDVKPANILMDEDGNAIVTDFGIAKVRESPTHTMTGATVGTPAYMSPEQCWSREVTGASDQYSLGIVAYEMLAGAPPFIGPTLGILRAHVEDPPPPLRQLRPDIPEPVAAAVARMLAKEPHDRFPDVMQAVSALGGRHLPEHDAMREELAALAMKDTVREEASAFRTPVSPIPTTVPPLAPTPRPLTAVVVTAPSGRSVVGEPLQLHAIGRDAAGVSQAGRRIHWSSSNPQVATVSTSGVVTPLAPGSVTITASSDDGVSGATLIEIAPPPPPSAEVTGLPRELRVGDRAALGVAVRDAKGATLTAGAVRWSASDPGVARVTPSGHLQAVAPGSVTLTAEVEGGVTAAVTASVLPPAAARVEIAGGAEVWYPGGSAWLAATVRDATGAVLSDREVRWKSEDPRVAAVNADGRVTAKAEGVTAILASCEERIARLELRVLPAPVASLGIEPPRGPVKAGRRVRLRAEPRDAGGRVLRGRPVRWASRHPQIAEVDSASSRVRAVAPGLATLEAACESVRSELVLEVAPAAPPANLRRLGWMAGAAVLAAVLWWLVPWGGGSDGGEAEPALAGISIGPTGATLRPGESLQLSAGFRAADGSAVASRPLAWATSDTTVLAVSEDGRVTARAPGSAVVTAEASGIRATSTLMVAAGSPDPQGADRSTGESGATLVLSRPPARLVVGDTFTLVATGGDPDRAPAAWRSSRPAVATVSESGAVAALSEGTATITASNGGTSASVVLRVSAPPVGAVVISPATRNLTVGDTVQLSATILSTSRDTLHGKVAVWESSDPGVASVTPAGLVSAVGPGSARITVTSGGVRGGATLTAVARRGTVAVVEIAPLPGALEPGTSAWLTATARSAGGTPVTDRPMEWHSSQPEVATVDEATGVVTARGPGQAEITATSDGVRGAVAVTVGVPPAGGGGPGGAGGGGAALAGIRALAAGGFTCALAGDGSALCWGQGEGVPTRVGGQRFGSIVGGLGFACGLTGGGQAFCWGSNGKGQLGDGSTKSRSAPTLVSADLTFTSLSAGEAHACGVSPGGNIYCWGNNGNGQLGDGTKDGRTRPTQIRESQQWKQVVAGGLHSCGLTTGGRAYCWGDGFSGELGQGMMESSLEPVPVTGGLGYVSLTAGRRHTCGLTASREAYCWGDNRDGQLGSGSREDAARPAAVAGELQFGWLSAGSSHTCGVTAGGRAMCWGANASGQVGDGGQTTRTAPAQVKSDAVFTRVSAGAGHTCGLTREQSVLCWGGNGRGQLGDGTRTSRPVPAPVQAGTPSR